MFSVLALVLSCCGDGGTVTPGPWVPGGGSGDGGSCSSCSPIGAQYWTGAADGTLTAEKNLGALSTGLVKNTSGVPSQYAGTSCTNQFPRSLNNSGAATCASVSMSADVTGTLPEANGGTGAGAITCTSGQAVTSNGSAYSCTSGPFAAGGSSPQVQYNSSGVLAGMANYTSDGTWPIVTASSSAPATPASGSAAVSDWSPETGFPGIPYRVDPATGGGTPASIFDAFTTGINGSNWTWWCGLSTGGGTVAVRAGPVPTQGSWNGNLGATFFADGGASTANPPNVLLGRIPWTTTGLSATANSNAFITQGNPGPGPWLGNVSGSGGFVFWTRVALHIARPHSRYFFGVSNAVVAFTSQEPSTVNDVVAFEADNGATNLSICSAAHTGSASCSSLGAGFPIVSPDNATDGGIMADLIYDLWLAAPPCCSDSHVYYYISRPDTGGSTYGSISGTFPANYLAMHGFDDVNVADGGGGGSPTQAYFNGMCVAWNY